MVKPLGKVDIQPGSTVTCEQSEKIERFGVNEVSAKFSASRKLSGAV